MLSFIAGLFLWKKQAKGILLSIINQIIQTIKRCGDTDRPRRQPSIYLDKRSIKPDWLEPTDTKKGVKQRNNWGNKNAFAKQFGNFNNRIIEKRQA